MGRPGYVSFYADNMTNDIFEEFIEEKGISKTDALSDMMMIYMLAKDADLYNKILQDKLGVGKVKDIIDTKNDVTPINDYIFMKLSYSTNLEGERLNGLETIDVYKKVIAEKGETWFSTRAMHSGMNKKKVAFFNKAIKAGENVYILFALSDNINNVRYIATVKEIYSSREEVTCPGDVSLVPKEYGQDEVGKIWFRITDLKETSIRAENLYFRSNDENVKERINVSQCHFGYVYEK